MLEIVDKLKMVLKKPFAFIEASEVFKSVIDKPNKPIDPTAPMVSSVIVLNIVLFNRVLWNLHF